MSLAKLLVANRGEIALRVLRAAADLGIPTVAIHSEDDNASLHLTEADQVHPLPGIGARAYLDIEQVVAAARATGCTAVHPGYGFLSESAAFAAACRDAGLVFVGPSTRLLELFGDKVRARSTAHDLGVPVLPGTTEATTLAQAQQFFSDLAPGQAMILKAVSGGGGRGVRVVQDAAVIEEAFTRCASEALAAFGSDALYVEQYLPRARHIEVQVLGDGETTLHFGERDCSLQRRHQKILEIAPAPALADATRDKLFAAALALAEGTSYDSLGTVEFLLDAENGSDVYFIETNARLQVEHTITEEISGVDLVQLQLRVAGGTKLSELLPAGAPARRGMALQARINMETMAPDGETRPSGGLLRVFEPPTGPGIRVDGFGYAGYRTSPHYDSLLAKVIAFHPSGTFGEAKDKLDRALSRLRVEGVPLNTSFLRALLEEVEAEDLSTRYIDEHMETLASKAAEQRVASHVGEAVEEKAGRAGVEVDAVDPLAVLTYGQEAAADTPSSGAATEDLPDGLAAVRAPMQGTIVSFDVSVGDVVRSGQQVLVMEAMKMEHEIRATASGVVEQITVTEGETLYEDHVLLLIREGEVDAGADDDAEAVDLDHIRPDLEEVLQRRGLTRDEAREEAVAKRHARGHRTARENVEDLVDEGTFLEYGPLVLAAQRRRRSVEELIVKSPADGMITGVGSINGDLFEEPHDRCAVLSYDYTVFAGTQGTQNHRKTDRLIGIAERERLPLVIFAEGGGGRPGDTDQGVGGPGDTRTFSHFPRLSGLVPLVGITNGRCFAGNASLLGCCDVVIATEGSNIGMGGPAMIEGGGLGVFAPEDIGGMDIQVPNGVVDIAVADESEAVAVAKKYLSYFQGRTRSWECADQRRMRGIVPENRLRIYDIRDVIETLADTNSVLELRPRFGLAMVTSLVRIEGRPVGVVANNPSHIGGAIDSDAADKATRFMQLCDAFDLPILFLCDTPGIMVGPEVEKTALVRHANRMFLVGANVEVPFFTIVIRKAYGLGGIAMGGGSYKDGAFTVSWPTGEFGGMGLEGSVKLGYRAELAAIEDPQERKAKFDEMVALAYENGKALHLASQFGIDDAIDPAESRAWVAGILSAVRPKPPRAGKKRPWIDAW